MHFVRVSTLMLALSIIWLNYSIPSITAKPRKVCIYWCKENDKYYCCPDGKKSDSSNNSGGIMEEWLKGDKPWAHLFHLWTLFVEHSGALTNWLWLDEPHFRGHRPDKPEFNCPELRPACPKSHYDWYKSPNLCDSDENCANWEKCCFDACLDHKTCKPAVTH